MTAIFTRGCGAALIYTFAAQAAFADLTAQDVWSDWSAQLSDFGYEVTGTETTSGNTLTVSDASFSRAMPNGEGEIAFGMGQIQFQENSDGSVVVTTPERMPITFDGSTEKGEEISGVVDFIQSGHSMTVSGAADAMTYDYTAATAKISLTSLTIDGEAVPASVARMAVTISNIVNSTQIKTAQLRTQAQQMTAETVSYDFAFSDPESNEGAEINGALQGLAFEGTADMPLEMDPDDFPAMLKAGFGANGTFTYASGSSNISGQGDGETFSWESASQGGSLSVEMSADSLAYDISQNATALTITSGQLPFPIVMNAAKSAFNLKFPVSKSEADQDFALGMTLANFTMSDMLWNMFDPSAVMPRDPATVDLDLTGKAKVLVDFLDPAAIATLENSDQDPGELSALTINKLLVSMVGARLTGNGDFTFDNTDKASFDGMPKPTGYVDLELTGGNGVIDRLIQMGFVTDQDAMGARMMMGLLAVPGDTEDSLKSKIEINDQGHIMANGQRIQ